jgi:hypothetical protein
VSTQKIISIFNNLHCHFLDVTEMPIVLQAMTNEIAREHAHPIILYANQMTCAFQRCGNVMVMQIVLMEVMKRIVRIARASILNSVVILVVAFHLFGSAILKQIVLEARTKRIVTFLLLIKLAIQLTSNATILKNAYLEDGSATVNMTVKTFPMKVDVHQGIARRVNSNAMMADASKDI